MKTVLRTACLLSALLSCILLLSLVSCASTKNEESANHSTSYTESTTVADTMEGVSSSSISDITSDPSWSISHPITYGHSRNVELEYATFFLRSSYAQNSQLWTMIAIQSRPRLPKTESFTVPSSIDGVGFTPYIAPNPHMGLYLVDHLIFAEGIEAIDLSQAEIRQADNITKITLPSTLHTLIGYPLEKDTLLSFATILIMNNTFPSKAFPNLQEFSVDEDNPIFDDADGILYQNHHLLCIPQAYSTPDGTVTIRDGTIDLYKGAVTDCRNIRRLIVPDSVIDLQIDSITATVEHPLTVVCSRGSAAAEYVEWFGEMYHLTVEYTD